MMRSPRPLALFLLLFLAGCQSKPEPLKEPLIARFFLESRAGEAGVPLQLPVSGVGITVNPQAVFLESDLVDAELVRTNLGWCMRVRLTPAAARDLYRLSVASIGRRLVLTFNGLPAGAGRIDQAMPDGALLIYVEVQDINLPPLVERLKRTSADIARRK